MLSLLCIPILIGLCFLTGCQLTLWFRDQDPERVFWHTLLSGLAMLIVILTIFSTFLPVGSYAAYLAAAIILLAGINWRAGRHGYRVLKGFLSSQSGPVVVLASLLAILLMNLMSLVAGKEVYYQSGGNYDALHWVVVADQLRTHDFLDKVDPPAGQDVSRIFNQFSGWKTWDGRVGGELVLSFISVLLRTDPLFLYNLLNSALLIFWAGAVRLFLGNLSGQHARWLIPALILSQPIFAFAMSNSNYPNLFGSILFGYLVLLAWRKPVFQPPFLWALAMGITGNAILASYPELLPFGFLTVLCFALREIIKAKDGISQLLADWFAAGMVLLFLNPVNLLRGMLTVLLKQGSGPDLQLPKLFADLELHAFVPALSSMAFPYVTDMPFLMGLIVSVLIIVTWVFAVSESEDRFLFLSVFVGFAGLWLFSYLKQFPYGYQKTVINNGVLVSALCWIGLRNLFSVQGRLAMLEKLSRHVIGVSVMIGFVMTFVLQCVGILETGMQRNIAFGDDELGEIRSITGNGMLVIDDASLQERQFYDNWLPYAFRDRPTYFATAAGSFLFPDERVGFDGYWRWYGRVLPDDLYGSADFLLRTSPRRPKLVVWDEEPLYTGERFALYEFSGTFDHSGIYAWEGTFSWASESVKLYPRLGPCQIHLQIGGLHHLPENNRVLQVKNHYTGVTRKWPLEPGMELSLIVPGTTEGYIELESLAGAVRPSEIFDSTDNRPMAYQIESITLDPLEYLHGIVSHSGLHEWEGSHVWMTGAARLEPEDPSAGWLNLKLLDRLKYLGEGQLLCNGQPVQYNQQGEASLKIVPGQPVTLTSTAGAAAPIQFEEDATDDRMLSYCISHLSATRSPLFEPSNR